MTSLAGSPGFGPGSDDANNPNQTHTLQLSIRRRDRTPSHDSHVRLRRNSEQIHHRKNVATRNATIIRSPYSIWSWTDLNSATFSRFGSVSRITIRS